MNTPEKGFYYHYKHDPAKGIFDTAYEVIGNAFNTEAGGNVHTDDPEVFLGSEVVIYRPLFDDSLVYKANKRFWFRPVKMFFDKIEKDGKTFPRFQKITDPEIISKLEKIRNSMYTD